MMDKQQLLDQLQAALIAGTVSAEEIKNIVAERPATTTAPTIALNQPTTQTTPATVAVGTVPAAPQYTNAANLDNAVPTEQSTSSKLSAVEVMYYIAGLILYGAIMSLIAQSWDEASNGGVTAIMLGVGAGSLLWTVAYVLLSQKQTSDIRKGLENAIILTGSLCIISGGFIVSNQLVGGYQQNSYFAPALTFAVLGIVHLLYDRLVRKDLVLLLGILLSVITFPVLVSAIIVNADVPSNVWSAITIGSALLLMFASRTVARFHPNRPVIARAFDPLAAFIALGTMFASGFGPYGIVWTFLLIVSVIGLFYLSIVMQNKHLLGNAAFFLVVAVLTICFRYFSGLGVSVSLICAAFGLLGSAAVASSINKKYFKQA